MLIAYPDTPERKRELARLIGVADHLFVEVEGHACVHANAIAFADDDLPRETADTTSAMHLMRLAFTLAQRQAARAGAAGKIGCDPTHYPVHVSAAAQALARLAGDLR